MKTTNQAIAFAFEENAVRVVPNAERPLFVAKDVASALGYEKPNNAIMRHCKGIKMQKDDSPKQGVISDRLGRKQQAILIDEPDVYRLIFGSKLESAKKFQDWVFEEVLPTIRKTGQFGNDNQQTHRLNLHNMRVRLLKELEKAKSTTVREGLYQSLSEVSSDLGIALAPLNDFQWAGVPAVVREEANAVCDSFFDAVEALSMIDGVNINHSDHPNELAVQLSEIIRLGKEHNIDIPKRMDLIRYLPYSQNPEFLMQKCIASCVQQNDRGGRRNVRCWLFKTL